MDKKSIWIDISRITGTLEINRGHRERYVKGEISYEEWSDTVVASWKGFSVNKIDELARISPLMNGSEHTVQGIKEKGYHQVIISNSITLLADRIGEKLGIGGDCITANVLEVKDDKLTGRLSLHHGWQDKVKTLRRYAKIMGIDLKDTVAIGDDINDIEMIKKAGLGIAFDPKNDLLKEAADIVIDVKDLRAILSYI